MGNFFTTSHPSANDSNESSSPYYYYPSKIGRYFGNTFIMGGEKFEMSQPESYLFGENFDLNYLGGRPNPFPYTAPLPNEPMQMIRSLINIRKETVKLICSTIENSTKDSLFTIEFTFDSDVNCEITIYFLCKEQVTVDGCKYIPKNPANRSATYYYKAGIGQQFSQTSPIFNPHNYDTSDLLYQVLDDKGEFNVSGLYPVIINCVANEGEDPKQSHTLIASIEKVCQVFLIKPLKQKIFIDGLIYLLQEIYGIENKSTKLDSDNEDNSFECVICMSELRDTLILPCRHLCLCNNCADSLRYQASNCPICRVPFRALLQIKAVKQKKDTSEFSLSDVMIDDSLPGYESIPLVEALNGINLQSYKNHKPLYNNEEQKKIQLKNTQVDLMPNFISDDDGDDKPQQNNHLILTNDRNIDSASSSSTSSATTQDNNNFQEKKQLLLKNKTDNDLKSSQIS